MVRIWFFSIYLGTIITTDFHIFQRGWNHQPVYVYIYISIYLKIYIYPPEMMITMTYHHISYIHYLANIIWFMATEAFDVSHGTPQGQDYGPSLAAADVPRLSLPGELSSSAATPWGDHGIFFRDARYVHQMNGGTTVFDVLKWYNGGDIYIILYLYNYIYI